MPTRAGLIISKYIQVWPLSNMRTRDLAAASIRIDKDEVVVASMYLPHDVQYHPSPEIIQLVQYCEKRKHKLLLDANSHHQVWCCFHNNGRGEELVEFLANTDLHVQNRGHSPSFVTTSSREILDVTISTASMMPWITKWRIEEGDSKSDHETIRFRIKRSVKPIFYRKRKQTNWEQCPILVEEYLESLVYSVSIN